MDFASWLENELDRRGMSRAELARRGGISAPQVTRVLNREQNPGTDFLQAVARAFGVSKEVTYRAAGLLPQQSRLDDLQQELIYVTKDLGEDDMEEIIGIAKLKESIRKKGRKSQITDKV